MSSFVSLPAGSNSQRKWNGIVIEKPKKGMTRHRCAVRRLEVDDWLDERAGAGAALVLDVEEVGLACVVVVVTVRISSKEIVVPML